MKSFSVENWYLHKSNKFEWDKKFVSVTLDLLALSGEVQFKSLLGIALKSTQMIT